MAEVKFKGKTYFINQANARTFTKLEKMGDEDRLAIFLRQNGEILKKGKKPKSDSSPSSKATQGMETTASGS